MFKEKVIKGLICVGAIMLAAKGWAVAKEATQGTETQALKPKLIWEKDLSDLNIKQVSDLSPEGIKAVRASVKGLKVKPEPLMAIITGEEDEGNEKVQVIMSDGEIKTIWKQPLLALSILTRKGQMPSIVHGKYIKISDFEMKAHFPIITKETWLTLDGKKIYEGDKICNSMITPDGKYFYKIEGPPGDILTPEEKERGKHTTSFYDLNGNLLWQVTHIGEGNQAFSPDGSAVAIFTNDGLVAYDIDTGRKLWSIKEFPHSYWEKMGIVEEKMQKKMKEIARSLAPAERITQDEWVAKKKKIREDILKEMGIEPIPFSVERGFVLSNKAKHVVIWSKTGNNKMYTVKFYKGEQLLGVKEFLNPWINISQEGNCVGIVDSGKTDYLFKTEPFKLVQKKSFKGVPYIYQITLPNNKYVQIGDAIFTRDGKEVLKTKGQLSPDGKYITEWEIETKREVDREKHRRRTVTIKRIIRLYTLE